MLPARVAKQLGGHGGRSDPSGVAHRLDEML